MKTGTQNKYSEQPKHAKEFVKFVNHSLVHLFVHLFDHWLAHCQCRKTLLVHKALSSLYSKNVYFVRFATHVPHLKYSTKCESIQISKHFTENRENVFAEFLSFEISRTTQKSFIQCLILIASTESNNLESICWCLFSPTTAHWITKLSFVSLDMEYEMWNLESDGFYNRLLQICNVKWIQLM